MRSIFEEHAQCPCLMKLDLEKAADVYSFLQDYYPEITDRGRWNNLSPEYLECTYCILKTALSLMEKDVNKYGREKVAEVVVALETISERYAVYKKAEQLIRNGYF